jgi:UDP-glucose 4-epimerase
MRCKDARQTFLGIWLKNAVEKKPIKIYGTGNQLRDFNYIDDVVDALISVAMSDSTWGEVFNLGSSETFSLTETARIIQSICPNVDIEYLDFPEENKKIDIGDYFGNYQKLHNTVGWEPKVNLRQGIKTSIDYFTKNLSHYID